MTCFAPTETWYNNAVQPIIPFINPGVDNCALNVSWKIKIGPTAVLSYKVTPVYICGTINIFSWDGP